MRVLRILTLALLVFAAVCTVNADVVKPTNSSSAAAAAADAAAEAAADAVVDAESASLALAFTDSPALTAAVSSALANASPQLVAAVTDAVVAEAADAVAVVDAADAFAATSSSRVCKACKKVLGAVGGFIIRKGCGFWARVELGIDCEALGGGPEDPLADICAIAVIAGCTVIKNALNHHLNYGAICHKLSFHGHHLC